MQKSKILETLKQALISILVGAAVSFLTVVFQELIHYLDTFKAEIPGAVIGMAKYLHSIRSNIDA